MFKYILKRLGLALVVLFGVSVIIYFLVRLMPTDYLENKFSAQLQQGTITREQLDEFQKRYGLYMPEAYLELSVEGYDTFKKDAKLKRYEDVQSGIITYAEFYAGKYESKKDIFLELNKDGTYRILDESEDTAKVLGSGSFVAAEGSVTLAAAGGDTVTPVNYREASLWNKFTAVLGGYFSWLGNMLRGDLGDSFLYQQPVGEVIADHTLGNNAHVCGKHNVKKRHIGITGLVLLVEIALNISNVDYVLKKVLRIVALLHNKRNDVAHCG